MRPIVALFWDHEGGLSVIFSTFYLSINSSLPYKVIQFLTSISSLTFKTFFEILWLILWLSETGLWLPCQPCRSLKRGPTVQRSTPPLPTRHFHPPQKSAPVEFPLTGSVNPLNIQLRDTEKKRKIDHMKEKRLVAACRCIDWNRSQYNRCQLHGLWAIIYVYIFCNPKFKGETQKPVCKRADLIQWTLKDDAVWKCVCVCVLILLSGRPSILVNDLCQFVRGWGHSWGHQPHGQENSVLCFSQLLTNVISKGRDMSESHSPTIVTWNKHTPSMKSLL